MKKYTIKQAMQMFLCGQSCLESAMLWNWVAWWWQMVC